MNKQETGRRAALYVRVSTDAQREEGYSIDAQREMLEAYCVSKRISDYELYTDGGFSGSSLERPEMKRLIADVKAGRISSVIVYKLDRLSRSQKDTLYLIEDVFNPAGTGFVSLNENMDTATPIGRAMLGIMSAFAQLERETIRERTRLGMRERVKSGLWMGGGRVPFGYDYDKNRGILVPNRDAEIVRKIYDLYLQGYSMMKIARAVGLKYDRMAEQILLRKTNAGIITYNGIDYPGMHEPIIPYETYRKAMALHEQRSRRGLVTARHLLAGLMYCGYCGAKMRYQKWGPGKYKIYCYSQDSGKPHLVKDPNCPNRKLWAEEVETIVMGDLFAVARSNTTRPADDPSVRSMADLLRERIASLSKKLRNLYNLYAESENDLLRDTIRENDRELNMLQRRLEEEIESGEQTRQTRELCREISTLEDAWDLMTVSEKQNLLRKCVDRIVITGEKIDIYYRFGESNTKKEPF